MTAGRLAVSQSDLGTPIGTPIGTGTGTGTGSAGTDRVRQVPRALIITVLGVLVICAITAWAAPSPIVAPWDVLVLLDGAYRMSLGQVPGTDFGNPVGPLDYGLTSLGMRLQAEPSLASVAYGTIAFAAVATTLAWFGTRRRLRPVWRAGVTLVVALTVVSPRPLGYSPFTTSYAMLYNRYGWVLLAIATIMVLITPKGAAAEGWRGRRLDAFALGLILGLALYTKVTFAVAVLLLTVYFCAGRDAVRRSGVCLAGVLLVGAAVFLVWRVNPVSYLHDVLAAGQVQSGGSRSGELLHTALWTTPGLLVMLVLGLLLASYADGMRLPRRPVMRLAVNCCVVVVAALVLAAGDADERGELPLLAVVPLLVVASDVWTAARPARKDGGWRWPATVGALSLVVLATAGRTTAQDGFSVAEAVAHRSMVRHPPAGQRIDATDLSDFLIPANAGWQTAYRTAKDLPPMLDQGIAMLRGTIGPKDRVFTMAYGNPFDFALGLTPTRGGLLWYDLGYDVDTRHFPVPDAALGDANWVMVPHMVPGEGCCQATVAAMLQAYGLYLRSDFTEVRTSPSWELWRRTRPTAPGEAGSS